LHPALVIPHLLLSIAVLGAAIVVGLESIALVRGHGRPLDREPRLAGLAIAAACFALVASGTIATAAGPHSGGKHVYRLWSLHPALLLHGTAVAVLGCSLVFLIGYLFARRATVRAYLVGTTGLAGLLLVQMTIGDIQYRTHLPWWLVLVHVAMAATVWSWTVALVALMWRPPAAAATRTA
jgi:cytochrome c oxidase assembly protein subunit 15